MKNVNPNSGQAVTQNIMLAKHLDSGNSITGLEALEMFGIMHLPRRILDLKQGNMKIDDEWIKLDNGKRVKRWWKKIK